MSNVIGINELFKMLDDYRIIKTNEIELEIINEKQKELGIEFPEAMILFYKYFGNDENIMSSFYFFDNINDIRIENDALSFGEKHQGMGRLGITLKHLSSNFQSVSWYEYSTKKWYSEGSVFPESFFFNIVCWQLINSMNSVAKVRISESELQNLLGEELY